MIRFVDMADWMVNPSMMVAFPEGLVQPDIEEWDHKCYDQYLQYVNPINMIDVRTCIVPKDERITAEVVLVDCSSAVAPTVVRIMKSYAFDDEDHAKVALTEFWEPEHSIPDISGTSDAEIARRYYIVN